MEFQGDRNLLVTLVKVSNYVTALLMVISACFRFSNFSKTSDPFFYLLTFYLLGFAALLVIAEVRIRRIIVYIEFLGGRIGKGIYILFVGLLVFDNEFTSDMAFGIIIFLVGIFNVIVGLIRKKRGGD